MKVKAAKATLTQCSNCEFAFSMLHESNCPRCKTPITLPTAAKAGAQAASWKWRDFITHATPHQLRVFQRLILLVSLMLFGIAAHYVGKKAGDEWGGYIFLSFVYMVVIGLLIKRFVPVQTLHLIANRTSATIKLALLVNVLTAVLVIQILVGTWLAQTVVIATVFGVCAAAAWVLCRFAWPLSAELYDLFFQPSDPTFDPTQPQGRQARHD